jgi:glycosyltransferase involved in cell wall biosynthesis
MTVKNEPPRAPALSIIVPFYNEEDSIGPLYAAIVEALEPLPLSFEMIFVDDGSRDATLARAIEVARNDPRVRVVRFRQNRGQTPAMAAGIDHARGEVLVTMDGDLQNDPRDIPLLLGKIDEGYDLVVGWRHDRQDKLVTRKIPSRIANWLIAKVTRVPIRDNGCSLKAYRAALIKQIPLYSEMHRFIPAMAFIAGPRIAEVQVRHHARQFGESKYGLSRIYKVLLDLLVIKTVTSFMSRPLVWFAMLSVPALLCAFVAFFHTLFSLLTGTQSLSLVLVGTGALFSAAAVIAISSGMLGELVYKLGDVREHEFARLNAQFAHASRPPPTTCRGTKP